MISFPNSTCAGVLENICHFVGRTARHTCKSDICDIYTHIYAYIYIHIYIHIYIYILYDIQLYTHIAMQRCKCMYSIYIYMYMYVVPPPQIRNFWLRILHVAFVTQFIRGLPPPCRRRGRAFWHLFWGCYLLLLAISACFF